MSEARSNHESDLKSLRFQTRSKVVVKAAEVPEDMIKRAVGLADEALANNLNEASRLLNFSRTFNLRGYCSRMTEENTIYSFKAKDSDGADVSLDKYRGKVLIVVNTASQCGFTNSNYSQLKELLDKYKSQGLEVAAFPCNQFGNQEPGCDADIKSFVSDKFKFDPDLYSKVKVNGEDAHPLFKFLKKEQGGTLFDAIKWNFTKFLVNREGKVVGRYAPTTEPKSMVKDIEKALNNEL